MLSEPKPFLPLTPCTERVTDVQCCQNHNPCLPLAPCTEHVLVVRTGHGCAALSEPMLVVRTGHGCAVLSEPQVFVCRWRLVQSMAPCTEATSLAVV